MILYWVITKLFHIFTLFGYGVWIFFGHIGDQTLSFIYTCVLLLLRLKSGLVLAKFLFNLKKKEFYISFESPCRFYAKYFFVINVCLVKQCKVLTGFCLPFTKEI